MIDKVGTLSSDDQALFLRKLIESHRLQLYSLTPNTLKRIQNSSIDIGVYVAIESVLVYKRSQRFLYNNELYKILRLFGANNKQSAAELWSNVRSCSLFTRCYCQAEEHKKPLVLRRLNSELRAKCYKVATFKADLSCEFYIDTTQQVDREIFQHITQALKQHVPTRTYDRERRVFIIPEQGYSDFVAFLLRGFGVQCVIEISERTDMQQKEDLTFIRNAPYEMVFCEGRESKQPHSLLKTSYHWCSGRARFRCNGIYRHEDYSQYTLFDFLNLLCSPIDDHRMSFFYGKLNWFNNYLEHLFCHECGTMLDPDSETAYRNAHRSTYFRCPNQECHEHTEVIYLNHCFKTGCNGIIDSRESTKCPNGFVICQKCGVCCSYQQFVRKSPTGALWGNRASQLLIDNNNLLHLERKEFYCPKCGVKLQTAKLKHPQKDWGTEYTAIHLCNNLKCENYLIYGGIFPLTENGVLNYRIKKVLMKIKNGASQNDYKIEI